ncbi:glycerol-3-phosphate-acyltransferase [Suillus tomentosus]|nr:glycerol-3-phosphate-acyltransferase [Suillus tomentosus]
MSDSKVLHLVIRRIADWSLWSFFTEVRVIGGEHVPLDGPIIVTATHHNMMIDPAILSSSFPHRRVLHYWSKASLFANPVLSWVLHSSGNIPVDRKSKNRQDLFRGTIEALARGDAVALFPEGTSYTEPRIMQVKDGAAWAALEYTKWAAENGVKGPGVRIIPAAIVYTNKSKYRSSVIVKFGEPVSMDEYKEQFFSDLEGAPRAAAKRLTGAIERELVEATINAPDWDTLYSARMARDLLWEDERSIDLEEFVTISQTLVDLFSTTDATANFSTVRRHLLGYYSLLQSTNLTNSVLSSLPLPPMLSPSHPTPLPSRLLTLSVLIRDTLVALTRLPFFLIPLLLHTPVYVMGRIGARLVEHEEETQAQNKAVFGLLSCMMIYPATFWALWAMLWYTGFGAIVAAFTVWAFAYYHNRLINDIYMNLKRVIAAWRVLVGVWAPRRWELSLSALSQYTTPLVPPENPWIDKNRPNSSTPGTSSGTLHSLPAQITDEPPVRIASRRRPSSRRIMRHLLRARGEAVKALAEFLTTLEASGEEKSVIASIHLAKRFGWVEENSPTSLADDGGDSDPVTDARGYRRAREVIAFLRSRGAKIATLDRKIEGDWALSSDEDGTAGESEKDEEDLVWVPSSTSLKQEDD